MACKTLNLSASAAALAIALVLGWGYWATSADAQPPFVPNPYAIVSPTGKEIIKAENTGTFVSTINLSQARDSVGYAVVTQAATNAFGVVGAGISDLVFTGATSGTLTVTTQAAPNDGTGLHIFSAAGFSSVTITANAGQTIVGAVTSMAANSFVEYRYNLSTNTWFRNE